MRKNTRSKARENGLKKQVSSFKRYTPGPKVFETAAGQLWKFKLQDQPSFLPCCMYLELIERFNLGQVNVKTKVADRIVVVTTSSIIKLDNKYKVMKTISLEKVSNPSQEGWSIMPLRVRLNCYCIRELKQQRPRRLRKRHL